MEVKGSQKYPADWRCSTIGDAFAFLPTANNAREDLTSTDGVGYLHYGDIHTKWRTVLDLNVADLPKIDENKVAGFSPLQDGDLIIADASEDYDGVGVAVEVRNIKEKKAVAGLHTLLLREKGSIFVNGFKGYLQYVPDVRSQLIKIATGVSVYSISKSNLANISIPVPSSEEQRSISAALSDVDALIKALDRLIAKKRDIKQAAMQELLTGKRRLPGFGGESYKQTEEGVIPEDWEVKTLYDVTDCLDNLRVPLNESQRMKRRGEIPYCGANGVLDYIDDFVIDDDIILMAEDGGYFDEYSTRPIAYRMIGKCWVNNHAHILKAKTYIDQGFVYYSIAHKNILRYIASGTRSKLNRSELNKIEIALPSLQEQTSISTMLSDMDADIAALEDRRDKTKALKQGMMQELLTGRIRLVKEGAA